MSINNSSTAIIIIDSITLKWAYFTQNFKMLANLVVPFSCWKFYVCITIENRLDIWKWSEKGSQPSTKAECFERDAKREERNGKNLTTRCSLGTFSTSVLWMYLQLFAPRCDVFRSPCYMREYSSTLYRPGTVHNTHTYQFTNSLIQHRTVHRSCNHYGYTHTYRRTVALDETFSLRRSVQVQLLNWRLFSYLWVFVNWSTIFWFSSRLFFFTYLFFIIVSNGVRFHC